MYKKILMLVLLVCLGDTMRLSRFYSISRGNYFKITLDILITVQAL